MLWLKDLWCVNFAASQRGVLCLCERKKEKCMSVCPFAITVCHLSKSLYKRAYGCQDLAKNWHEKGRVPKLGGCFWSWNFFTSSLHHVCTPICRNKILINCAWWCFEVWAWTLELNYLDFVKTYRIWLSGGSRSQACESSDHRLQWVDHPVQLNGPTHSSGVTFWAIFLAFCGSSSMFDWGLWSSHQCVWQLLLP